MSWPAPARLATVGLLSVLLFAAVLPAVAQAPAAGGAAPAREGPPLGVRFALPNGVVVLVAERPALPIVTVKVALGAGAVLDPPDKPGLANLTAVLLTRGTQTRTGPEIDRAIELVGGTLETEGGRDVSNAGVAVLRRDLALGLDLLADVLLRPTFPAAELERKREEVAAAIRQSEEDPETVAGRLLRRLAFPGHPYGAPIAGTEASVRRLTREDVTALYAAAYRPDTTVIAVVGDVTVAEVRAALSARFGGWTAPPAGPRPGPVPLGAPARAEAIHRELTQATVYLGKATVTRPHPDYYPLVVATHILGGASSSRLYTRVREERGLAYSIYGQYITGRLGGLLVVSVQSENARTREVLDLVREEILRIRSDRVSEDELARAKAYLIGSFPLSMDTNGEVASLLLGIEQFGLPLDYPARYRKAIAAVTADDIRRVARAHWDPDLMSRAVVANLREAGLTP